MIAEDIERPAESRGVDPAKRRQIIDGASRVFLAQGFDAASMGAIAREAGVSKGTLYVYFKSKEELFEAIVEEQRRQQAEEIFTFDGEAAIDAELRRVGLGLARFLCRPGRVSPLRTVIAIADRMPEVGAKFYQSGPATGIVRLKTYLEDKVAGRDSRSRTIARWPPRSSWTRACRRSSSRCCSTSPARPRTRASSMWSTWPCARSWRRIGLVERRPVRAGSDLRLYPSRRCCRGGAMVSDPEGTDTSRRGIHHRAECAARVIPAPPTRATILAPPLQPGVVALERRLTARVGSRPPAESVHPAERGSAYSRAAMPGRA